MAEREQKEPFRRYTLLDLNRGHVDLQSQLPNMLLGAEIIGHDDKRYVYPSHGDTLYDGLGKTHQYQRNLDTNEVRLRFISDPPPRRTVGMGKSGREVRR